MENTMNNEVITKETEAILLDSLDYSAQELFLLLFKVSPNLLMRLRALVVCPGVKLLAVLPVWVVPFLK